MRQLTEAAQTAKLIRKDLGGAFPGTTFTVRSSTYAGGDSVRIDWTDGPGTQEVDELTQQDFGYSCAKQDILGGL